MRRIWPVAAAVVLMLAGCGDDAPDADTPAPPASATATTNRTGGDATATPGETAGGGTTPAGEATTRAGAGTAGFVSVVREQLPEVAVDRRDDEIAAVAEQACASLAAGDDADAVVAGTRSLGTADAEAVDHATARELIKLAIDTVCPDQDRRVDEF